MPYFFWFFFYFSLFIHYISNMKIKLLILNKLYLIFFNTFYFFMPNLKLLVIFYFIIDNPPIIIPIYAEKFLWNQHRILLQSDNIHQITKNIILTFFRFLFIFFNSFFLNFLNLFLIRFIRIIRINLIFISITEKTRIFGNKQKLENVFVLQII